uniref:Sialate O-acetylesterase domain-containing protein n=1 Tax=Aegilops tauschii subsp. strangulata TaxID=200361 RepID=A0A453QCE8_AEGTS
MESLRRIISLVQPYLNKDAMGLPIANDITHLTTQAHVRLGKMLTDAYISTL